MAARHDALTAIHLADACRRLIAAIVEVDRLHKV